MKVRAFHPVYQFEFIHRHEDVHVGQQVAAGNYELFESELIRAVTKPDTVALDVGANIGYYTLLLAGTVEPEAGGQVYAFEPARSNFEILLENLDLHALSYVFAHQFAVGAEPGEVRMYLSKENLGDHHVYATPGHDPDSEVVPMIRLDDFIEEHRIRPDLIKVDTQGFDYFVLRGLEGYLASDTPLSLFTEFWPHGNRMAGASSEEYFALLERSFSTVEIIDRGNWDLRPATFDEVMAISGQHGGINHVDLLCRR